MAMAQVDRGLLVQGSNGGVVTADPRPPVKWSPGTAGDGKRETLSLTGSSNNTITVPTGATWVRFILGSAVSLTLKGASGDTGIALTPASNPRGLDVEMPLSSASIVIHNGSASAQTIEALWL